MSRTAKLFMNGRSQAVRLPAEFRFDGTEVNIERNAATGEVILSSKTRSLDRFFKLMEEIGPAEPEFMAERDMTPPPTRKIF